MKKERIGGRESRRHISEEEKKRNKLIYILIGVLVAIFLLVLIIMIPKGKKDEQAKDAISTADSSMIETNNSTASGDKDRIKRDPAKVTIEVDTESLTEDNGVITITDTNDVPYKWTPIWRLQQYVNGEWEDMELKNPENAILPDTEYDNPTGTMTQSLVWVNKYGKLEPGTKYRIVKEADGTEFYAEFIIR